MDIIHYVLAIILGVVAISAIIVDSVIVSYSTKRSEYTSIHEYIKAIINSIKLNTKAFLHKNIYIILGLITGVILYQIIKILLNNIK